MRFIIIPVTPYQQNCSLLICNETGKAALVDPGGESERLLAAVAREQAELEAILVTHGHLDHVGAVAELAEQLKLPVYGPQREDAFWLEALPEQCRAFGFPPTAGFTPDRWLNDGDTLSVGAAELQVLHCPGHTPGHVVYYHAASGVAWVGDVLFKGSVGRSDFPKGDHATLLASIRDKLFPLGATVRFVPGHGPMSTFGAEMRDNPFVGQRAAGLF